jgi:Fe-S cluster assembly protein SufD
MVIEKSNTAQQLIDCLSGGSKVGYMSDQKLSEAILYLERSGIPTNKNEDYKYCNLDAVLKKEFKSIKQEFQPVTDISQYKLQDTITLVVVNGVFSESLSDKIIVRGLNISSFSSVEEESKKKIGSLADEKSDAFIALNTLFSENGFYLKVEKNTQIPMPFHIIYITNSSSGAFLNTRNVIEVMENSSITIIEQQVSTGSGKVFSNLLSEKFVRSNAGLTTALFQDEGDNGYSVNTNQVNVERDGRYTNTTITLSGAVVRNNHNVVLAGENGEAHLYGLFSAKGHQLIDNHTLMDHQVPHCESNELYKGIVDEKSTGVFNGKIFVRKDAQKTNAYQSSKNILLSDDATINTKPQLEIYADDVKCSHGTSTGKIDENALFYLKARGISNESARKMLLSSFAQEVINKIEVDSLREKITAHFEREI